MVALIARPVFIFNTLFLLLLGVRGIRADEFPLKQVKLFTWVVDYEPFWSPDGKQIVLISSRHGGMKVHVLDASGSMSSKWERAVDVAREIIQDSPSSTHFVAVIFADSVFKTIGFGNASSDVSTELKTLTVKP